MSENSLKKDWIKVTFGDVVNLNNDKVADPAAEGIERYVGLEHIVPEDLQIYEWGKCFRGNNFYKLFQTRTSPFLVKDERIKEK